MNLNWALFRLRKCLIDNIIIVALSFSQALTVVSYDWCGGSV